MKKAVVVGGNSGIGLSAVHKLLAMGYENITVFDRSGKNIPEDERITFVLFNLLNKDFSVFDEHTDADALFITAGLGRLAMFEELEEQEIINGLTVNAEAVIRIIGHYYRKIKSNENFYCGIMGSITGLINSPLFSVYSAAKGALCRFIESINSELEYAGSPNRILNASPGVIKGTSFYGAKNTDLDALKDFTEAFVQKTFERELLFIPNYESTYKGVVERYIKNPQQFGLESIEYKKSSGRLDIPTKPQIKVGYLSGTFDLFHIGHLNILRRAKQYCDYLVVGVHRDGSHKGKETFIPFEERKAIVSSISYTDKVIEACKEDSDIYKNGIVKYDYLFAGSDYKGTKRFLSYEEYFKEKGVEIVYFPYTKGTSSTQLREIIEKKKDK